MLTVRKPEVAGQFYPAQPGELKKELSRLIPKVSEKKDVLGMVSPHAGYIYSGEVAAACFAKLKLAQTAVILGPNHTGQGRPFSIMTKGTWETPLGKIKIDSRLAKNILSNSDHLQEDSQAHLHEHAIEVQLPFLQYCSTKSKIVPIVLSNADFNTYDEIGRAIARGLQGAKRSLVIASSDMTHYAPQQQAEKNDNLAIQAILRLDGQELLKRINKFNITMCGYGPVITMLSAVKQLGAKKAKLLKYQTSGQTSGDYSSVVGYAGILVF